MPRLSLSLVVQMDSDMKTEVARILRKAGSTPASTSGAGGPRVVRGLPHRSVANVEVEPRPLVRFSMKDLGVRVGASVFTLDLRWQPRAFSRELGNPGVPHNEAPKYYEAYATRVVLAS
jgi:hypothetical protein